MIAILRVLAAVGPPDVWPVPPHVGPEGRSHAHVGPEGRQHLAAGGEGSGRSDP